MKQGGPTGGVMPPTIVEPPVREEGQLVAKVGPNNDELVEVSPNVPSSILAKRKRDDGDGMLGHKKSRAPFSLRALRQAAELMLIRIAPSFCKVRLWLHRLSKLLLLLLLLLLLFLLQLLLLRLFRRFLLLLLL